MAIVTKMIKCYFIQRASLISNFATAWEDIRRRDESMIPEQEPRNSAQCGPDIAKLLTGINWKYAITAKLKSLTFMHIQCYSVALSRRTHLSTTP